MRIPEFWTRAMALMHNEEAEGRMIIDGFEPEVVIYRGELDLEIPVKSIELVGGKIRVGI